MRHCCIVGLLILSSVTASSQNLASSVPPNEPATVEVKGRSISFQYHGTTIFSAVTNFDVDSIQRRLTISSESGRIEQVLLLWAHEGGRTLELHGRLTGSEEAFPCEVDRPSRGPLLVRSSSGLSQSLRNRAVYDRREDWVLSVDQNPALVLIPVREGPGVREFSLDAEGREIVLRFRPRYYQMHRGLRYFEPWTYRVWPLSVAGWISWFAFFDKVSERDMVETAKVFAEKLLPFGYEYFQMDDGYQRGRGRPELWLIPNAKFPRGLPFLTQDLKANALKPGIWTAVGIDEEALVTAHPEWFVRDSTGKPVKGTWINYVLDASNPGGVDSIVRPLYRGLREQGWEYFKVDALRHLRYEGYNANREYFSRKQANLENVYRNYMKAVREEIGTDCFTLGCWGIRPELAGLIDGCRIGDDGFSYAGLAQYNSFNNVVWRNDPDHIVLDADAYRSTTVTSLTGSLLMLTDKPPVYRTEIIEAARRAVPVPLTVPGQIYDVDPSRSDELSRVGAEVSGSGPRPFDAGYTSQCNLYLLEINREFGSWYILGRTGGTFPEIRFGDLGLDPAGRYLVFEFWTKHLLGVFHGGFDPGPVDPKYRCQVFCIRKVESRPQFVASSRHVTCGGVDLEGLQWKGKMLVGRSRFVANDPYVIYLTNPPTPPFVRFECPDLPPARVEHDGPLLRVTLLPKVSGMFEWRAVFDEGVNR